MKKYAPLLVIVGLMLVTIVATMTFANTPKNSSVNVGGTAQRWSYSTVTASSTSVGTTATLLIATSTTATESALILGEFVNESSQPVFICAFLAACTTSNGQPLSQYGYLSIDDANPYQGAVYGITSASTATVSIRTIK